MEAGKWLRTWQQLLCPQSLSLSFKLLFLLFPLLLLRLHCADFTFLQPYGICSPPSLCSQIVLPFSVGHMFLTIKSPLGTLTSGLLVIVQCKLPSLGRLLPRSCPSAPWARHQSTESTHKGYTVQIICSDFSLRRVVSMTVPQNIWASALGFYRHMVPIYFYSNKINAKEGWLIITL